MKRRELRSARGATLDAVQKAGHTDFGPDDASLGAGSDGDECGYTGFGIYRGQVGSADISWKWTFFHPRVYILL